MVLVGLPRRRRCVSTSQSFFRNRCPRTHVPLTGYGSHIICSHVLGRVSVVFRLCKMNAYVEWGVEWVGSLLGRQALEGCSCGEADNARLYRDGVHRHVRRRRRRRLNARGADQSQARGSFLGKLAALAAAGADETERHSRHQNRRARARETRSSSRFRPHRVGI